MATLCDAGSFGMCAVIIVMFVVAFNGVLVPLYSRFFNEYSKEIVGYIGIKRYRGSMNTICYCYKAESS